MQPDAAGVRKEVEQVELGPPGLGAESGGQSAAGQDTSRVRRVEGPLPFPAVLPAQLDLARQPSVIPERRPVLVHRPSYLPAGNEKPLTRIAVRRPRLSGWGGDTAPPPHECQCEVIPLTCPRERSGHLHHLVWNRGRTCRGCAGRLPGCRACEPRTNSTTVGRGWNPALQGCGGCQAASVTSRRADSPVVFAPAGSGTRRRQGRRQVRSGERSLGRTDRGACHGGEQRAGPVAVAGLAWVRVTYDPMVATISTGERRGAPTRSPTPDRASIQAGRETAGIRCMCPPWKRLIRDKRR